MSVRRLTSSFCRATQFIQEMEAKSTSCSVKQLQPQPLAQQQQQQQHQHQQLLTTNCCQEPSLIDKLNIKFNDDKKIMASLKLIENTFHMLKPEETMLCFNGGKDCSVIIDMLKKFHDHLEIPKINNLYIRTADPFEEVEEYVHEIIKDYKLKLHEYTGDQKTAMYMAIKQMPNLRAVFMGSRRTDPHCENYEECMITDSDWPKLIRIFPLLEWNYNDVWHYLLANNVPYCKLYDKGYTSLGEKSNTSVNMKLMFFNEQINQYEFKPAYELDDIALERSNRLDDKSKEEKDEKK